VLWQAAYHMGCWLGCSHLANIARRVNRKIQWDPQEERVVGDEEANLLAVNRPRRQGWEI
jgi:hypothetical protein